MLEYISAIQYASFWMIVICFSIGISFFFLSFVTLSALVAEEIDEYKHAIELLPKRTVCFLLSAVPATLCFSIPMQEGYENTMERTGQEVRNMLVYKAERDQKYSRVYAVDENGNKYDYQVGGKHCSATGNFQVGHQFKVLYVAKKSSLDGKEVIEHDNDKVSAIFCK